MRLRLPDPAALTPEQQAVYDATLAGPRRAVPGNVRVWLHSPELASRAQHLGAFLRYQTTLVPRHAELAILVVARHTQARYEWAVHEVEAARAGVPPDVIAAIADGRQPPVVRGDDRAVFDFATALVTTHHVPDVGYQAALAELGERALVELVAVIGYYTLVAMTLNAFEIDPP
jgi:4-carboxymuconolactone decarboxylase